MDAVLHVQLRKTISVLVDQKAAKMSAHIKQHQQQSLKFNQLAQEEKANMEMETLLYIIRNMLQ